MIKRTGVLAAGLVMLAVPGLGGCSGEEASGPSTGVLEVLLSMEGADQDLNGGVLYLNGQSLGVLSVNVRRTELVETGIHVIRVDGINGNCVSIGDSERNVTIRSGQTSKVEFSFLCASVDDKDPGGDPVE